MILKNISYEFSNKIYWLQGDNGAGKSVLFRCMSGIEKFTAGTCVADIENILYIPEFSLNEEWLTLRENASLLAYYHKLKISGEQMSNIVERLLPGQGDVLPSKASVGMNMKTAFALIFVPSWWDLIIIDEAISHIDKNSRSLIFSELAERSKEKTIVLFSYHGDLPDSEDNDCQDIGTQVQLHDIQALILKKEGLFHE